MRRLKFYAELVIEPDGTTKFKVSDYTTGVKPIADGSRSDGVQKTLEEVGEAILARAAEHEQAQSQPPPAPAESQPSEDESPAT